MIRVSRQNPNDPLANDLLGRNVEAASHCYAMGGEVLVFDSLVAALSAFKLGNGEHPSSLCLSTETKSTDFDQAKLRFEQDKAVLRYQGYAPFAEINRAVSCWELGNILRIDIDEDPVCLVDLDQDRIHLLNTQSIDEQLNLEVITGPALIALMAQNGVFCLHAGAVSTPVGNVLFIAESGVGKSTLSADAGKVWIQIADDISPILINENGFSVLPFPQLKLAQNIPSQGIPQSGCCIDLIVRLARQDSDDVVITKLKSMDSFLQLIKHTVAAKLFNAHLLEEQAVFAQKFGSAVPMVEIHYPRDLNKLESLRTEIAKYLSELPTQS